MRVNKKEGDINLTNSVMLNNEICETGMKITAVARNLGITREAFYKKLNNETEFKASEISAIQKILHLSNDRRDEIFFAENVELESTKRGD